MNQEVRWIFLYCFFYLNMFAFLHLLYRFFQGSLRNSSTSLLFQDFSKIPRSRFNKATESPGSTSECLLPIIKLQMQFTTHVGDDLAKPVFEKGAAFVFKYQAGTSKSESKIRIFSPSPRIPAINLTQATYIVEAFKRAPDSTGVMYINKNCKYMHFNETCPSSPATWSKS